MNEHRPCVYCSGPLFCPEELAGMTAIARVLEGSGFRTFLPQRDGLERRLLKYVNHPLNVNIRNIRQIIDRAIFALDLYQIVERCDFFVFNMNGRVPDEGGVAEAAMAFMAGKPLVLYKNDRRSAFNGGDNSMIKGLTRLPVVSDVNAIPGILHRIDMGNEAGTYSKHLPTDVKSNLVLGRRIWKLVDALPGGDNTTFSINTLAENILDICRECEIPTPDACDP